MYPHQLFQNSSSSFFPETSSSSKSGDATDGVPNYFDSPSPSELSFNNEEPKEKDSSDSVDPLPHKDSSSPFSAKK